MNKTIKPSEYMVSELQTEDQLPIGIIKNIHDVMGIFNVKIARAYEIFRDVKNLNKITIGCASYEITKIN